MEREAFAKRLMHYVIGQNAAIDRIATAMADVRMCFGRSGRPGGIMLLGGPCGVGKAHTVRSLQYQLTGSDDDLTVFKMSDYTDPKSVSRMFGVTSQHEGNAATGELAAARNAPFATIAFEGIEHTHESFFQALLPILMTGSLQDASGHKVDFRERPIHAHA